MRSQPLERQLPVNSEAVWKSVVIYLIGVAALVYLILFMADLFVLVAITMLALPVI